MGAWLQKVDNSLNQWRVSFQLLPIAACLVDLLDSCRSKHINDFEKSRILD